MEMQHFSWQSNIMENKEIGARAEGVIIGAGCDL